MIQIGRTPCVTVLCDDCGEDYWEEGAPHWESVAQARKYLADDHDDGWLFTDTEQVCPGCQAWRRCKAEGHVWGEWRQWPRDDLEVVRFCDRCTASDYTVRETTP